MGTLDGRSAVVTGAGGGIGRAASVELARAGALLTIVDRDAAALRETEREVGAAGAKVISCVADVSVSAEVTGYVNAAVTHFGRIDAFFNNAGIEGPVAPLADYPEDGFDQVIAVNLKGVFLGLRHVLPVMIEQGAGAIVNTASMAAVIGLPGSAAYCAAKAGVTGLTRVAATEVARKGIRVNAVLPGVIETRMTRSLAQSFNPADPAGAWDTMAASAPMGRFGTVAEIASVVRFLLSDEAGYVTGAGWQVDGGWINCEIPPE
jgi:NAD(P)-dependent dehydrogenase (short-subunit alcohol dehydrogenase family)